MYKGSILVVFFALQLFAYCSNAMALDAVTVTVTIPTKDLSDTKAMAAAKNKAVIHAMETLPSVVWGSETLKGMHYSEYVRSISFAYADVTILNETFDRQSNTLTITSSVSWDEQKIKTMLSEVSEGEKAKNTLTQITKLMQSASLQDYIRVGGINRLSPLEEATLLVNPHFFASSYTELQRLFMATVYQIAQPMKENLFSIADAIQITLERADNQYLYYQANKPATDQHIQFMSKGLSDFYQDNKTIIDDVVGELCFFSVDTHQIYKWDGFLKPGEQILNFRIDTKELNFRFTKVEKLFQQQELPLEILICSDGAIDNAKAISRLEY